MYDETAGERERERKREYRRVRAEETGRGREGKIEREKRNE